MHTVCPTDFEKICILYACLGIKNAKTVSKLICILYICMHNYKCETTYVLCICLLQPTSCSLHFHMGSSKDYNQIGVYSRNSAPGVIVAHGGWILEINIKLELKRVSRDRNKK